ncbi:hypothetical protein [Streptomyces malaysiense]|uniref:Uncharacterized protein n=1 Tax=Streptomyces malaysiense TaxID=1428626 RepID=A0A1J4PV18_9ACTN|nr:hypothetical protein [Streptomyces malaysiense]OIK24757.1 hypothetical protein VT52_025620 [Streptomyces malaysiense]
MDTETGRVGIVMAYEGAAVWMRPYGGGREWEADPVAVRAAAVTERIRAETAYANARSRGEVL